MGAFAETGFHRNGLSLKRAFTETGFHRNGFSPNPLLWRPFTDRPFTEKYGLSSSAFFHRMERYYSPFNGDSKTGLRSSLAALESEIQAFKVFSNFYLTFIRSHLKGGSHLPPSILPPSPLLSGASLVRGKGTKLG